MQVCADCLKATTQTTQVQSHVVQVHIKAVQLGAQAQMPAVSLHLADGGLPLLLLAAMPSRQLHQGCTACPGPTCNRQQAVSRVLWSIAGVLGAKAGPNKAAGGRAGGCVCVGCCGKVCRVVWEAAGHPRPPPRCLGAQKVCSLKRDEMACCYGAVGWLQVPPSMPAAPKCIPAACTAVQFWQRSPLARVGCREGSPGLTCSWCPGGWLGSNFRKINCIKLQPLQCKLPPTASVSQASKCKQAGSSLPKPAHLVHCCLASLWALALAAAAISLAFLLLCLTPSW